MPLESPDERLCCPTVTVHSQLTWGCIALEATAARYYAHQPRSLFFGGLARPRTTTRSKKATPFKISMMIIIIIIIPKKSWPLDIIASHAS